MRPQLRLRFLAVLFILIGIMALPMHSIVSANDEEQQSTFASPILVVNTSFLNIRTGPSASYSILATVVGGTELPVLAVYEDLVWYQVATNLGPGWVNVEFTLARGDFSHVPLAEYGAIPAPVAPSFASLGQGGGVVVTGTSPAAVSGGIGYVGVSLNGGDLRNAPSGNAPIVAALVGVDPNQIYPLLDIAYVEGRPMYKANLPQYGVVWSEGFRLRPMACGGLSVIEASEVVGTIPVGVSSSISFVAGDEFYVVGPGRDGLIEIQTLDGTRGLVPVDKTRGRSDSVVSYCDGATPIAPSSNSSTTVPVAVPVAANLGQGGGVAPAVVVPAANTAAARLIVNTGNLNIRTGPSASYGVLATAPGGTELPVTAVYEDLVWYQVATNLGAGWVNVEYTLARGDFSRVPLVEYGAIPEPVYSPITVPAVANVGQGGGVVVPTTGASPSGVAGGIGYVGVSLNGGDLRNAPSGNAPIVAALVGVDPNQIYPLLDIAYVEGRPMYKANLPQYGVVWSEGFRLRPMACGGLSVIEASEVVGTIPVGVSSSISFVAGDEFYVVGPGRDGLIEIQTLDGTRGLVPVDKTRGRSDSVVSYCDGATPIAPSHNSAANVVVPSVSLGQGGGVAPAFAVPAANTAAARLIVNTGNLNIRTGPSASYGVLATVPGGTELPVTAVYEDLVWYQVATNLGAGWVNVEYTLARGDFSRVPLVEYGSVGPAIISPVPVSPAVFTAVGQGGGVIVPNTTASNAAARVIVNTGSLNIRTGPSANFSIVATVGGGTELAVLGVADDGVWYLVQGPFGQGWLNNEFVIFRGDYSAVPVLNINP